MRRVTVLPPTKSRMLPKLGTVSATKRRKNTLHDRKAQRFQLKAAKKTLRNN